MARLIRAAMTETANAFPGMPDQIDGLAALAGRLEEVRQANLDHHYELIAAAAAEGVQVLGLGELFAGPYFALAEHRVWLDMAEDALEGPTATEMKTAAREHRMILIVPLYELDPVSGKRFNAAVVIDEQGRVLGRYRKTHIPHGTNEQARFIETVYYERSDGKLGGWPANVSKNPFFPVFDTALGKIGVAICYDRHFPGVMETLAEEGAEIVFCPAVTFGQKSRSMWELEFLVDAARNKIFIAGSNRRGKERPWNVEYFGASYFAGPHGRLPARHGPPGLVIADLDLETLNQDDPAGWDLDRDSRPEIYNP